MMRTYKVKKKNVFIIIVEKMCPIFYNIGCVEKEIVNKCISLFDYFDIYEQSKITSNEEIIDPGALPMCLYGTFCTDNTDYCPPWIPCYEEFGA